MNTLAPLPVLPLSVGDRTADILLRIRTAFVEKGFDGASMQDLAKAAGMSVGNFYRYFPSKAAIIEAMVGFDMAEMERDFATIRTSGDPMAALRVKIAQHVREDCAQDGQLWAEITAAAMRKPEIGAAACRMEDLVAGNLLAVFGQSTGLNEAECQRHFGAHARFLVLMVKAAAMCPVDQQNPAVTDLILKTIDRTLDDISRPVSESLPPCV